MKIAILGIAGTFMGSLAQLAVACGHEVVGVDEGVYPPMSEQLRQANIPWHEGYDLDLIAHWAADLFLIGNVIRRGNRLMEAILEQGLPYQSGPEWLKQHVLHQRQVIAVAGTHGKTTTASLIAHILEQAGLQPGFLIGGVPQSGGLSARLGQGAAFVIEADEYDTAFFDKRSKFLHYPASVAVLNNLEFDHADIFEDLAAIERQFHHWIRTLKSSASVCVHAHEPALERVLERGCWSQLVRYGASDAPWHLAGDQVLHQGQPVARLQLPLAGEHNRANALAAIAACYQLKVSAADACAALASFGGVKRRLELIGTVAGVKVYDDFAHHPSAIATTLAGLKQQHPQRLLAVLEPRSATMKLGTLRQRLPEALALADHRLIYTHQLGWDSAEVFTDPSSTECFEQLPALIDRICAWVQPGDAVLIMSNGGFGGIHQQLLKQLQAP